MATNIMIVGVGGQGSLLASRVLGHALLSLGHDVKVSEVHGMSQRGGSVVTYVKYGDAVHSPVITEGEADYILSFEMCEAARAVPYLRMNGRMIVNSQEIDPMPVITGAAAYPAEIESHLRALGVDLTVVPALELANQAGSAKATNIVLLGVLSRAMDLEEQVWLDAIKACVPQRFLEMNLKAFELGRNL